VSSHGEAMKYSQIIRFMAIAAVSTSAACAPLVEPTIDHRGYIPDNAAIESIRPGVDNKLSVSSRLGTPSTKGEFNGETWYYISALQESYMFRRPKTKEQDVLAIRFDSDELVQDVAHYGLADGKVFAFSQRTTPTRGREMTFLEQMFGNFGRLGMQDPETGPTRGPGGPGG